MTSISRLSLVDAAAVHQLIEACRGSQGLPAWSLEDIEGVLRRHVGWGDRNEQGLIAFVLLQELPGALEILYLATAPCVRRQGRMRTLLTEVFAAHSAQAGSPFEVWLEVHEANISARQMYESFGFRATGRRPRYYADGGGAVLYSWTSQIL